MPSFICHKAMTGFDDKAELQEFEPTGLKLTFTITCRRRWWLTEMQRLQPFAALSLKAALWHNTDACAKPGTTFGQIQVRP